MLPQRMGKRSKCMYYEEEENLDEWDGIFAREEIKYTIPSSLHSLLPLHIFDLFPITQFAYPIFSKSKSFRIGFLQSYGLRIKQEVFYVNISKSKCLIAYTSSQFFFYLIWN